MSMPIQSQRPSQPGNGNRRSMNPTSMILDIHREGRINAEQASWLLEFRRQILHRRWRREHPIVFALWFPVRLVFG